METPPENSGSRSSFGLIGLLLVLAVGAGMYFLGRRSHSNAPATPSGGAPAAASAEATPSGEHHFAPRGTFYLLQYVSVKTPNGVTGFEPGQEVHFVSANQASQTLVVTDGKTQVEVGPDKLTNDLDIAAMVRQKDQSNQNKIAAYVQKEQKAYDDSKRAAAIKTEQALDKIDQQKHEEAVASASNTRQNPAALGPNALDQPAVPVDGGAGYGYGGYGGSAYGSPYSYFGNAGVATGGTASAPANAGGGAAGGASRPANVGSAGGGR